MPEWNLVEAQQTKRAQASSKFALPKMIGVCYLVFAVLVLANQVGCSKIRGGGLDRNILRAGETLPSVEAQPIRPSARFANDPSDALLELNDAHGEYEGSSLEKVEPGDLESFSNEANASKPSDLRIVEGSQRSYNTDERAVTLVAVQPPAPSIKDASAANDFPSNGNIERVLLGGVPLSEIEPINPAKVIAQCDHTQCDCMKEKLKPVLPFAQPVEPPAITQNVPPSELVSQPLAPIMFDKTTRRVEELDEQLVKQNQLRKIEQNLVASPIVLEQKLEAQPAAEPIELVKTESKEMFYPTVDPNLGKVVKTLPACLNCESYDCSGDCNLSLIHI